MSGASQEVRYALRRLWQSPGFTAAALAILGLAIGANVAVFSIVDGMLLRPLPLGPGSERVVTLHAVHPSQAAEWDDLEMSWKDIEDVRREARTLTGVSAYAGRNFALGGGEVEAVRARGGSVTPGLFETLGVEPLLGRRFRPDDAAAPGFESVALLGYGLWQNRYGGDPQIVGRQIVVNERRIEVVGVMPRGFGFPERDELWLPFRWEGDPARDQRGLTAVARLTPGASLVQARDELLAISARLAAIHPDTNRDWSFHAVRFRDFAVTGPARATSVSLLVAVGLVLLAGCANLAALLLARGAGRARELAIRAALGAGRARLVRQALVESLMLAAGGGALGGLVAWWTVEAVQASFPEPLPFWLVIALDGRSLVFALAVTLVTGVCVGIVPALRGSRVDLLPVLSEAGRAGSPGRGAWRLQGALVVGQIAVSLGLLVGASLTIRSFLAMRVADPGFDTGRLASLRLQMAGDGFDAVEARLAFLRRVEAGLGALPGVTAVAATGAIPADDGGFQARVVSERRVPDPRDQVSAQGIVVGPGFFDALGVRLVEGRDFEGAETEVGAPAVTIVNQALAQALWPGESAVGRRLGLVGADGPEWHTVVGVAPHVVYEEFGEETAQSRRNLYVPYARSPWRTMALLVRTDGDPGPVLGEVRRAFRRIAPHVPVYDASTLEQRRVQTTWGERVFSDLLGAFAGMALLLACIGVYGLMAVGASQRLYEIGIRLALGADRPDVLWLLMRRGLGLAALGLLLGLPLALGAGAALQGAVFAVEPFDPLAFAVLAALLAAAVAAASYLPARRAAATDPALALRHE